MTKNKKPDAGTSGQDNQIGKPMSDNIVQHLEGELRVSSEVIAERTGTQHKNVMELVRSNQDDLRTLGELAFETRDRNGAPGPAKAFSYLNEPQATLIMTFMRNSDIVKAFKLELVKQFYAMRQALTGPVIPQTLPDALRAYASEVEHRQELEAKVEADAPKVLFADAVSTSRTDILVGDLAKILRGNGVAVGANRLFGWLRDDGFLIKREGSDWNMPTQRSMELGLFRIKETAITHSDGHVTVSKTPKVTGKGQTYFVNRFLNQKEVTA